MDKNVKQDEEIEEIEEPAEAQEVEEDDEVAVLKQQLEDSEAKYKRALADYQNLEKRVSEQRLELIKGANKDLLLRILTVLDTLLLAQQHVADKNLDVSINHFLDVLKSEGLTRIKTIGEKFDPMLMEAITVEEGDEGKVINEVRAGFLLHDKLLRAAQVTVGAAKQN
jgi:molecular chaperone GrpE